MRCRPLIGISLALALAGCVTVHNDGNGPGPTDNIPKTSKADQLKDAARIHTDLAQHYLAAGNLEGALEKLKLALQFDPNYIPAHTVIAFVYEKINKLPEAEANYRQAVALAPDKGDVNNNLGQFLCRTGKPQESIGYFKKAVADPFYATPDVALTNAGICQLQMGDQAGAEASFRDAIARNPGNGDALFQLAEVLYKQGDAFRAAAFIQRFDALGKPTAASLKLGYDIESRLGHTDAAQTYLRHLQSQFPDSEQARAMKATASNP
ncbi:type IV pilus biogenesis/stability protein PilW [Rhodanobacter sp. DHB23]|uniref:type IV pilus biogenesis/stability protein PilW n=1 Tax=Rhodanobacter sp. DHB23 TaxID=2775923 RepID=UPI00177D251E|nr:type IV pilus biogenesis/stability protein PilW [Rhodanobacter sp. DHB23]MBD8873741.1 type IV pilus biogenesis/stability protein PilW [Rhodanobacter sp. DHB23]